MFVYQNKDNAICITFKDNKPVEAPEYVITVDKEAGTLTIAGASDSTTNVDTQSAELQSQLDTANATIAANETTINELEARIAELEAQLEEASAE